MEVKNLVFNRLGNNISILIDYPQFQIQIWDKVKFNINDGYVEIKSIAVDFQDKLNLELVIYRNTGDINLKFSFTDDFLKINDEHTLEPYDEGYIWKIENPDLLFKIGMNPDLSGFLQGNSIKIHQQDFFKNIASIFSVIG
ncbi:hypothetical protein [Persephonella sp. KM09-Lau-8]|uniref:hypothetical protein n=1 Tax=Persephonella sp. KM09-Lau-8 TaxID=1158345 RepID=UPI00049778F7|nr:hypothetical protein [Persephonella sp. KM09-Lau-8]